MDLLLGERLYVPVQGSVAGNAYVGSPGYGEVLVGLGVQSRRTRDERLQYFAQLLAGPNVHGLVLKPQLGITYGLSDQFALSAQVGRTFGLDNYAQNTNKQKFRANSVSLGLVYRFSMPGT
jgi:hypothetical protein